MKRQNDASLFVDEAEKRVWKAVDELEAAINVIDQTPDKRDDERRHYLASVFMSLLTEEYSIKLGRKPS